MSASLALPSINLTLDGRTLTAAEAGLSWLRIALGHGPDHDAVEVCLWRRSKLASCSPSATFSVAIDGRDVWSGEIAEVRPTAEAVVLRGLAGTVELSRRRVNQSYADETVADIVRDLAGSVPVDEVEGDGQLSSFSVDDRRPVWAHIGDLAALVGAERGASESGGLRFVRPRTGGADVTLRYGADLIAFEASTRKADAARRVAPLGAGSEAGAEKWHWLSAAPSPSGAGEGPVWIEPAARTRSTADGMADALDAGARRQGIEGTFTTRGSAGLRPGALVDVDDLPERGIGTLRLRRVEHALGGAGRVGFRTFCRFEGEGSGAGGFP